MAELGFAIDLVLLQIFRLRRLGNFDTISFVGITYSNTKFYRIVLEYLQVVPCLI